MAGMYVVVVAGGVQSMSNSVVPKRWPRSGISRADMEDSTVQLHERELAAQRDGRFEQKTVPVGAVERDDDRRQPDLEKIRFLPPLLEGGRLTAAVSSQTSNAASVLLVASERALEEHALTLRARVHHMTVLGGDR